MLAVSDAPTIADFVLQRVEIGEVSDNDVLNEALHAIRQHLQMEIAFISEFSQGRRVFRHIDAAGENPMIKVGDSNPLEESYCQRVVDGRLPQLICDACKLPAALELPVTTALPVGAHLSVPIRLSDGRIYGTLCCFNTVPDNSLMHRDLAMMRVFADFIAKQIDRSLTMHKSQEEIGERIQSVLDKDDFSIVYQPIYNFRRECITGFESLTRFSGPLARTPDVWFDEAASVGRGIELETKVIEKALFGLDHLPQNIYVGLNVSPATVLCGAMDRVLEKAPLERVVIEVTEHVAIAEYASLARALKSLRDGGARLAVDDAGAGYASFRHILELQPDFIKLDISLTREIDTNRQRRALAAALIRFAEETDSQIISEGVETEAELAVLRELGVNKAQGYLLGRPMPIADAAALLIATRQPAA